MGVMTSKEVAEYLKVGAATVTKLAKRGDIPGKKLGHLWRFDRATIDRWLTSPNIEKHDDK